MRIHGHADVHCSMSTHVPNQETGGQRVMRSVGPLLMAAALGLCLTAQPAFAERGGGGGGFHGSGGFHGGGYGAHGRGYGGYGWYGRGWGGWGWRGYGPRFGYGGYIAPYAYPYAYSYPYPYPYPYAYGVAPYYPYRY
jgi:hypothetical protein